MSKCVLFANDLRSYREAMAGTIRAMRPDLDVRVVAPDDLAVTIAHTRPRLVIGSALPNALRANLPYWLIIFSDNTALAGGEFVETEAAVSNFDLTGLVAFVDRAMGADVQ